VKNEGETQIHFYVDSATGWPHIHNHDISEDGVREILLEPGEDRAGCDVSRVAIGQSSSGRYIRVIYILEPQGCFVITAYELSGKALVAYRTRRKKKQQ
jgi:hypothetical protein